MRRAVLSEVGQTTSSRQSPSRSPLSDGVALVPLLEWTPAAVSSRVSDDVPYLSMRVWSSSSRWASPSHHITKLAELVLRLATTAPDGLRTPSTADDQLSAPGLPAQMSADTPRPLSPLAGVLHRT